MTVIVFTGDSITDADRRSDPLGRGHGYVEFVASSLTDRGEDATMVNTGVSGDRVADLQRRWDRDALAHHPDVLSIAVGVNDTVLAFRHGRATPPDLFEQQYDDLLTRAVASGVRRIVVVEPFFVGSTEDGVLWREGNAFVREDLDTKRPVVARLAHAHGAAFVPMQAVADSAVEQRGATWFAPDGVHPSPYGHLLMARAWLAAHETFCATS